MGANYSSYLAKVGVGVAPGCTRLRLPPAAPRTS